MALRTIVKEGDPILNKVCRPVTKFDDRLATLLDDMHETMLAADGVGLAGPQVGMLRRLFVVWDTTDCPDEIPADYTYKFIDFVNPEILSLSEEKETKYEGCLSFPGHNGAVERPVRVRVRAQDRHGEWFELEAGDLLGRCIQHENDHLDGVTILQSSKYFYEDTDEGRAEAAEEKAEAEEKAKKGN
jgi:peptide deformylase